MAKAKTAAKAAKTVGHKPAGKRVGGRRRLVSDTPELVVGERTGKDEGGPGEFLLNYELKRTQWDDLVPLKYNPDERTKFLKGLPKSIGTNGMYVPITVTPLTKGKKIVRGKYLIVDGGCRRATTGPNHLNWGTVVVVIVTNHDGTPISDPVGFREIQANRKNMAAVHCISMYLSGGRARVALPVRVTTILDRIKEFGGESLLKRMVEHKMSYLGYYDSRNAAAFLGQADSKKCINDLLTFFMNTDCRHNVMRRIKAKELTKRELTLAMQHSIKIAASGPVVVPRRTKKKV